MIQEICDFIDAFRPVRIFGCNNDLCRFLSYFFEDLVDSLIKQIIGIGALPRMFFSVRDNGIYILQYALGIRCRVPDPEDFSVETGTVSGMTGCSRLGHFRQKRITVTVDGKRFHKLIMT